ncbi:MAG: hypothetical protein ACLFN8_03635 [Candidatus Woesearchaeota archaeon]
MNKEYADERPIIILYSHNKFTAHKKNLKEGIIDKNSLDQTTDQLINEIKEKSKGNYLVMESHNLFGTDAKLVEAFKDNKLIKYDKLTFEDIINRIPDSQLSLDVLTQKYDTNKQEEIPEHVKKRINGREEKSQSYARANNLFTEQKIYGMMQGYAFRALHPSKK